MYKHFIIGIFICFSLSAISQQTDPYSILDSLKTNLEEIESYSANIEIEVDVDFINMPKKYATIYFKQPDKIKFKSKEFIMLPKRGVNNNFAEILNEPFSAIHTGTEKIDNIEHHIIKVIPMGRKPDIMLATWWINSSTYVIRRVESNTRNDGTYTANFRYGNPEITLPTEMEISFEIEKMKLPLNFLGKSAGIEIDKSKMSEGPQTGRVYIRFSDYVINAKMDDTLFKEEEEGS